MKILIAESDRASRRRLEVLLREWGYEVGVAADGNEAWAALQGDDSPRLAILDWLMPGKDGVELCQEIRTAKDSPYVYIIMLTARDRAEDVVCGLDAGADDYLTKPYNPVELRARLRAGRRILALQEALLSARQALSCQATLDPLSGVWNRAAILGALERELARAERQRSAVSVFIADLDRLRHTNEAYGYTAGDFVLHAAAQRIQSATRAYDSVGRYGDDEFVVIAPRFRSEEAMRQAERLRLAICANGFDSAEGMIHMTASVGVLSVTGRKGLDANAVVHATHAALARAKEKGRSRIESTRADDFGGRPITQACHSAG